MALGHSALEGPLVTRALRALEALGHSKDTWALGHSGTRVIKALGHLATRKTHEVLEALYLANSKLRPTKHFISCS